MMVSKLAVIALVAVIAVPILLGYAFNIDEVTETDYKASGEAVNVTPLLQNGTGYTYSHGDIYQLNTNSKISETKSLPIYDNVVSTKSSMPMYQYKYDQWHPSINRPLSEFDYIYFQSDDVSSGGSLILRVNVDGVITNINNLHSFYYDKNSPSTIVYTYYTNAGDFSSVTNASIAVTSTTVLTINDTGSYLGTCYFECVNEAYFIANGYTYVDFSSGFYFTGQPNNWKVMLPDYTRSLIMTIDLDSITDSNYKIQIGLGVNLPTAILEKVTTGGDVTWTYTRGMVSHDLYYNPTGGNTYQLYIDLEKTGETNTSKFYKFNCELRYIGEWPDLIGESNYYKSFDFSTNISYPASNPDSYISSVQLSTYGSMPTVTKSPRIRMDDAYFRAFEYPVIENQVYTPSSFKTNPSTKISDVQSFGRSIEFGGNSYTISSDGKITLGSQKIPINNLVLSSVPNGSGGYDNKIGNTIISTTAQPSTITFIGKWSANISTTAQESYTYTTTEWVAGHFAWDGMDHNFLLVGLITSFAAFIGCGIYAKKSRSGGIIPVMIVCGGAALMFFLML